MFLPFRDELGGKQLAEQIHGHGVFNHKKQFLIEKDQFIHRTEGRIHGFGQFFVFFVEQIGKRTQQCIFPFEIVIEGAPGGAGGLDNLVDGGIVIALLVKQLPGSGDDFALGVSGVFLLHDRVAVLSVFAGCVGNIPAGY